MKAFKKALIVPILFNVALFCGALSLADIQGDFDAYADGTMHSLPLSAAFGSDWSDAYVGNLPYHFGVGVSVGFGTTAGESCIKEIKNFGGNAAAIAPISGYNTGILPAYVLNFRIGGYALPFDIGGKIGYLWAGLKPDGADNSRYFVIAGLDLRYALLKGGATMPKVSLGVGFNYLNGGIELLLNDGTAFQADAQTLITAQGKPTLDFFWETKTLEFKAQISKTIGSPVFSPFFGIAGGIAWSEAGYKLNSTLTGDVAGANNALKAQGVEGFSSFSDSGFSTVKSATSGFCRLYGGVALNFAVLKVDLSYACAFPDFNYGLAINVRLQR
jgi:hypothetical protein